MKLPMNIRYAMFESLNQIRSESQGSGGFTGSARGDRREGLES